MRIRIPAAITTAVTAGMLLSSLLLPAAQADAATFPLLRSSTVTKAATGLEFDAGFTSSTALTGVQAYFYSRTSSAIYGPISLSLTSGDGTTGVWTAAPGFGEAIALPHDSYTIVLMTTDSNGAQHRVADTYAPLDYQATPDFSALAFSPTTVGYGNETVTASGLATAYEPESGDAGSAWSAPLALTLSLGASAPATTNAAGNGSFTVSVRALDIGTSAMALLEETHAEGGQSVTGAVDRQSISMPSPLPTRVLLDRSSIGGLTAGTHNTITGTVQYRTSGQWYPLAGADVDDYGLSEVTTDAEGRFSLSDVVPYGESAATTQLTVDPEDSFLAGSTADYQYTGIRQQVQINIESVSEDSTPQVFLYGVDGSTDGTSPGGLFAFEQSPNGKTGWSTLRWITLPKSGNVDLILPVTDPHGYWRLYSPTKSGYASSVSNTVHVFRWANRITGGRPSTTRIARGGTLSFSGTLWQEGYSPTWQVCGRQQMYLMFLPDGGRTWQMTTAYAATNAKGQFVIRGSATRSGTWQVRYYAASEGSQYTDAAGPAVHVSVD